MEYGFTQKLFGYFYHNSCMKQAKAQHLSLNSKAIKNEYKAVLERADDIGKSHLMSSYCMGAYFIATKQKDFSFTGGMFQPVQRRAVQQ